MSQKMNCHNIFSTRPKDVQMENSVIYKAAVALKTHRTDPILIVNTWLGQDWGQPEQGYIELC